MRGPVPLSELRAETLAGTRIVFTDIDDTVSTGGKLTEEAWSALWGLHRAGLRLVPVTGRPAGWCDHIARFWPVDAVVGENGAFYMHHDGRKMRERHLHDETARAGFRRKLDELRALILAEVPDCAIASDQPYRLYDLAVDFCEDVPPLPREAVLKIKRLFEEAGARAKISSIHVNGWFGDFDKLTTSKLCARELFGIDLDATPGAAAFIGDSPNDEPMFAFFPLSFGVANVLSCLDLIEARPAFVAQGESGRGFAEIARLLAASAA